MPELPIVHAARWFRRHLSAYAAAAEAHAPAVWSTLRAAGASPARLREARQWIPLPSLAARDVLHSALCPGAPVTAPVRTLPRDAVAAVRAATMEACASGDFSGAELLPDVAVFFAGWRAEKRVYRLTPELAGGLRRARWPATYPTAHLRPPAPAIVIELPPDPSTDRGPRTLTAHTNVSMWDTPSGTMSLWILELLSLPQRPPRFRVVAVIDLVAETLDGAFEATRACSRVASTARANEYAALLGAGAAPGPGTLAPEAERDGDVALVINTLLYLAGCADVVSALPAEPARAPSRSRAGGQSRPRAARMENLAPPAEYLVGVRYAAAVQRFQARDAHSGTGATGEQAAYGEVRSVRPHLRAPHAHLYWTGPDRLTPRVHFLPAIEVNGGPAGQDARAITVRRVRPPATQMGATG